MTSLLGFNPRAREFRLGAWRKDSSQHVAVRLTQIPPRKSFRAFAVFSKMCGPMLAPLVAGLGGLKIQGQLVAWGELAGNDTATTLLFAELAGRLKELDPDQLLELADELIVGHCTIANAPVNSPAVLDAFLPDGVAYGELLIAAVKLNFFPTSPDAATSGATSGGETQPQPAGI